MRSLLATALLCGLGIQQAVAQGETVAFGEPQPVTITGFAVASYAYDRALRNNSFNGNTISASLFKPAGDAYFFGQLTTSLAPDGSVGIDIDHVILSWTPHTATEWTFEFGRLHAPMGFEQDDAPLNLLPTDSWAFMLTRPSAITGAIVRYTPLRYLNFVAVVGDGWNVEVAPNKGKTGILRAEVIASDHLEFGVAGVYGPEHDSTEAFQRTVITPDVTAEVGPLILQAELNDGWELDSTNTKQHFVGAVGLAFLRLSDSWGVGVRYDHVDDHTGVMSGTPQVITSIEAGVMYWYRSATAGIFSNVEHTSFHIPQVGVRLAIRSDVSTQPFFGPNPAGGLETKDTQAILQFFYVF